MYTYVASGFLVKWRHVANDYYYYYYVFTSKDPLVYSEQFIKLTKKQSERKEKTRK